MQRHPSGCDPQAFRGRHSLNIPRQNARKRTSYDPVLESLPGMQTALGELERSGPSLYRGTIERSNLNRLANDLTEILVRHVNRIRFQTKTASRGPIEHTSANHEEPMVPRKRARPLRYIEELDHPDSRFTTPPRRPNRDNATHGSRTFSHRSSLPHNFESTRPQRRRRLVRYAQSEESDDDDVQELHRMDRPRRSKEIRGNLNDDKAYEYMERAALQKEEERRIQREFEEAEKQKAMIIDESSEDDDDPDFVPKVICPKPYVRERALNSDFASLTPVITEPDDDTDTEHYRKWNARRVRKAIHDDKKTVPPVQKQCLIFPVGRKTRLVRDIIVNTELMRSLAEKRQHHQNYKRILHALPIIPKEYRETGGRSWIDFEITEGFRKASSEPLFHNDSNKQHPASVTSKTATPCSKDAANGNNTVLEQKKSTLHQTNIVYRPGETSGVKEAINTKEAVNVEPEVSSRQPLAHEQSGRDDAPSRKLNGWNQTPHGTSLLLNQGDKRKVLTEPADTRTGKAATFILPRGEICPRKTQSHKPFRPRSVPVQRKELGRDVNDVSQKYSSSITQRTDGIQTPSSIDPNVLHAVRSNSYQQNFRMPHNHQMGLNSIQGGSSQMDDHYQQPVQPERQQQKHMQSIPTGPQTSTIAQVPPGQAYLLPGGFQRPPSKEEIQAYQIILQRGLATPQPNPQLLQIQAFQEWQRQIRVQSIQQQQILQQQLQQRQLLMGNAAHGLTLTAQQVPQNSPGIIDQRSMEHQFLVQPGHQASSGGEQRLHSTRGSDKSISIESRTKNGTARGALSNSIPLRASEADMNGRQSTPVLRQSSPILPGTQTDFLAAQDQQTPLLATPSIRRQSTPVSRQPSPILPGNQTFLAAQDQQTTLQATRSIRRQSTPVSRQSNPILSGTQTGLLAVQDEQAMLQATPSISGNRSSSLQAHKFSQTSNALILPYSDADPDTDVRDYRAEERHKPRKLQAPKNMMTMINEVSTSVANPENTSEVQLVKTRPAVMPTSSVKGVPGWQWERLNHLIAQTDGLSTVQNHQPELNATNTDQSDGRNARDSFKDHQRQYQEDYRAQYELQLRKVMEEIRKRSGGTGAEHL